MSGTLTWEQATGAATTAPPPPVAAANTASAAASAATSQPTGLTWEQATSAPNAENTNQTDTLSGKQGGKLTGYVANTGAGISDELAETLGFPVTAANSLYNLASSGVKAATGFDAGRLDPEAGANLVRSAEGLIGADPRNVVPATQGQALARAAGSGAASMALPIGPMGEVGSLAGLAKGAVARAGVGAISGTAGQLAGSAVSPEWAPVADVAAQILTGAGVMGAAAASAKMIDAVGGMGKRAVQTMSPFGSKPVLDEAGNPILDDHGAPIKATPGRLQIVGNQLAGSATDLPAVKAALAQPDQELVPGSKPTTYQVTQDPGLGGLERLAQNSNTPGGKQAMPLFLDRMAQNNAARQQAIQALDPGTASPSDVSSAFSDMMNRLTDEQTQAVGGQAAQVRQAVDAAGAPITPELAGRQIMSDTSEAYQPQIDAANAAVREAQGGLQARTAALGPSVPEADQTPLETIGAPIRAKLADNRQNMQIIANKLEAMVDPDNSLVVDARPLQTAVQQIESERGPMSSDLTSDESKIYPLAQNAADAIPFRDLRDLRSQVTDALRTERTSPKMSTQAVRRLSIMLDGVHQTMTDAVENRVAEDQSAVAAGQMSPEQTLASALQREQQAFYAKRASEPAPVGRAVSGDGASGGANYAGSRSGGVSGLSRGQGPAGRGYPDTAGNPRLPSPPLTPNFDEAAASRYAAANEAVRHLHETYDEAPGVGEAIRGGPTAGSFANHLSSVPHLMFTPGKGAAERIRAGLKAGLSPSDFDQTAAFKLRQYATKDGVLDPKRTQDWIDQHQEALSVLPKLRARFRSAAAASQALDDAQRMRDETVGAYPLKETRTAAEVARNAFVPGVRGAETVRQTIANAGGKATTVTALEDHAAASLRTAALRDDGTINQPAYQRWMKAHAGALYELPNVASRLKTVGKAQQALEDVAAAHRDRIEDFQRSAASKFLNGHDPVAAVGRILGSDRALAQMQDLAERTKNNPEARAGLQAAVVQHIQQELTSNQAAGHTGTDFLKSDRYQTFVRKTPGALRTIFSENQIKAIRAVADDLKRTQRSISGTQMPGRPSTAQDIHAGGQHDEHGDMSLIGLATIEEGARLFGDVLGEKLGAIGGIGGVIFSAARAAGISSIEQLRAQVMLHPRLAQAALRSANPKTLNLYLPPLLRAIRGLTLTAPIVAQANENRGRQ